MAGSINLSLSQQFDKLNGNLLSGGRLYFYAAGTDSPQNAFKDDGLTLVHPNPIILASDGRIPQLYFADGSIHVRLTDSGGVVQFDEDFVLVIGPSSGGGGGGGSGVDPNAIFQTGMMDWQPIQAERSGWVRCNGGTIGNGSSGATYHAAECQALYEHIFEAYTDAICPLEGGLRSGTTATTAYSSARKITLLDFRAMMIGGVADMGNANNGAFGAVPIERGGPTTAAGIIGEINHTLTIGEIPSHTHVNTIGGASVAHNHGGGGLFDAKSTGFAGTSGSATPVVTDVNNSGGGATDDNTIDHTHAVTISNTGGGTVHNTTPRIMLGTFYMRL